MIMACPECGCKTTYPYDYEGDPNSRLDGFFDEYERCAACGKIFDIEDMAEEDE